MIWEQLDAWDQAITLFLNSFHCPFSDHVWLVITEKYVWFPAYAVLIGFLIWRLGWKRGLLAVGTILLTILLVDQSSYHIKEALQRLRPCHTAAMREGGLHCLFPDINLYGFFSGHAANSFALIACTLGLLKVDKEHSYRTFAWCGYVWAALVALSRVMVGVHFFGDIFVGTLWGLLLGWLTGMAGRKIMLSLRI